MSRIKEQRFQVAGKEREKDWQKCGRACSGWVGGGADWQKERIKCDLDTKLGAIRSNTHLSTQRKKWEEK